MNAHRRPVAELLAELCALPLEQLQPQTTLDSLGLDSLGLLEVALAMQAEFGVDIDELAVAQARTIEDLTAIQATAERAAAQPFSQPRS